MHSSFSNDSAILVSVIIPAYNAEEYISVAIQSAQAQTIPEIEVIVVDDVSTDRTAAIVQEFARRDTRVRYARMAVNSGPAASRNFGLTLARGEWIALLDADDRFHPHRLETLVSTGRQAKADMISDNLLLCDGLNTDGRRLIAEDKLSMPRSLGFKEFIEGCYYNPKTPKRSTYVFMHPMFNHKFLKSNDIRYDARSRNDEDFLLYLDCLLVGAKWYLVPDPMYLYTVRDGSLTDIVSSDDHRLMVDKMRILLRDPRVLQDKALTRAITRHWKLIAPEYYYRIFKDAFQNANYPALIEILSRDKAAFRFVFGQIIIRGSTFGHRVILRVLTKRSSRSKGQYKRQLSTKSLST